MFNCRSPPPRASVSPPPPRGRRSRSPSRSRRSRSRSRYHCWDRRSCVGFSRGMSRDSVDASNPGNNLYVTGLSTRVTSSDLEKFFGKEGKVVNCNLVCDPRSKESRGFAFVTMESKDDADRCIKYLNRSVLEGRLVTVEKVWYV
ncbi:Serine/arginine-rich splicing factor SR45a [Linum grandiflorum]